MLDRNSDPHGKGQPRHCATTHVSIALAIAGCCWGGCS